MVCIIRSAPSAVPRPWLGVIVVTDAAGADPAVVARAIAAAEPQAPEWALAVEGDAAGGLGGFGLPVLTVAPGRGLAGCILAGLAWTQARAAETAWLLTIRGVVPDPPAGLATRLAAAVSGGRADMACWLRNGRPDFGFGFYPVAGQRRLQRALARDPAEALARWTADAGIATVAIDPAAPGMP